jgi:hypothetical protein
MSGITFTTDRFGNLGKAMQFNGIDGYIEVPNSASLQFPTNAITIAGWIYIDNFPGNKVRVSVFVNKTTASDYGQYALSYHTWGSPGIFFIYTGSSGGLS